MGIHQKFSAFGGRGPYVKWREWDALYLWHVTGTEMESTFEGYVCTTERSIDAVLDALRRRGLVSPDAEITRADFLGVLVNDASDLVYDIEKARDDSKETAHA